MTTFIFSDVLMLPPESPRGVGSGGYLLWPLFGTSNQLLAGISFLLITIWLKKKGRLIVCTLIPMIFLLGMALWAMNRQVVFCPGHPFGDWSGFGTNEPGLLLFVLGAVTLGFTIRILMEAVNLFLINGYLKKSVANILSDSNPCLTDNQIPGKEIARDFFKDPEFIGSSEKPVFSF